VAEALSDLLNDVRLMVPGCTTAAVPDATFVGLANMDYKWLYSQAMPRTTLTTAATNGLSAAITARTATTSVATYQRIEKVYVATANNVTVGDDLELLDEGIVETVANYESITGDSGKPVIGCLLRNPDGTWRLKFWPAGDQTYYFPAEVEIEVTALASTASTVVLPPHLTAMLRHFLAYRACTLLNRDQDFIDRTMSTVPDRKMLAQWLTREEERLAPLKAEGRG